MSRQKDIAQDSKLVQTCNNCFLLQLSPEGKGDDPKVLRCRSPNSRHYLKQVRGYEAQHCSAYDPRVI